MREKSAGDEEAEDEEEDEAADWVTALMISREVNGQMFCFFLLFFFERLKEEVEQPQPPEKMYVCALRKQ